MRWNSMVPMAWLFTDRGSLTQLERTNQSYLKRLSDQNNNRVIERVKNTPGSSKERNDHVPGDGSLWWLNVTTLWMSTLYYFVWHISNKRRLSLRKATQAEYLHWIRAPRSVLGLSSRLTDSMINWRSCKWPVSTTCWGRGEGGQLRAADLGDHRMMDIGVKRPHSC